MHKDGLPSAPGWGRRAHHVEFGRTELQGNGGWLVGASDDSRKYHCRQGMTWRTIY